MLPDFVQDVFALAIACAKEIGFPSDEPAAA
jgi:hypothetical protein